MRADAICVAGDCAEAGAIAPLKNPVARKSEVAKTAKKDEGRAFARPRRGATD